MELQTLALFALASLSINLIPGPDIVYIVSNTMKGSIKAGVKAALGLGLGYLGHTLAAVLGLSALLLSSALAFSIVKYLGAAYLLYLGINSLRNMLKGNSSLTKATASSTSKGVFRQGVLVAVFNPKVALFFLSFLPQFIHLEAGAVSSQLLILGGLFCLLATLCNLSYAVLCGMLFKPELINRYARVIEGLSGGLLVALAGKVALSRA